MADDRWDRTEEATHGANRVFSLGDEEQRHEGLLAIRFANGNHIPNNGERNRWAIKPDDAIDLANRIIEGALEMKRREMKRAEIPR